MPKASLTHIALLRGVNVSGHRKITMDALRGTAANLGWDAVQTYLQSGNLIFQAQGSTAKLAEHLVQAIERDFGHAVPVRVFPAPKFDQLIAANPLANEPGLDPSHFHVTFTLASTKATLREDETPLGTNERVQLKGDHYYLYCPNGYGRTKITNGFFERKLKIPTTTRNWRTVLALAERTQT